MSKKNENRSLFLYTALIFIVAILMIVVSYFSRKNLDIKLGDNSNTISIQEKTNQLSEENMILLQTTKNLNEQNAELEAKNNELTEKLLATEKKLENSDELFKIFDLVKKGDRETAKKSFLELGTATFTEQQLDFYEYLKEELKEELKEDLNEE